MVIRCSIFAFTLLLPVALFSQPKVTIKTKPGRVFIEKAENKQVINVDFIIQNRSGDTLTLVKLVQKVFDKDHHLILSRFLDNNGTAPSIQLLPQRVFRDTTATL